MRKKRILKGAIALIIILLVIVNGQIAIQAYSTSHFKEGAPVLSPNYKPSLWETAAIIFTGLDIPRPEVKKYPEMTYESISIPIDDERNLSGWLFRTDSLKHGLAIGFHGYMEEKSAMLSKALFLTERGYDVLLVDFMGAGGSYGNQTTLGYMEANNVKDTYDYAIEKLKEDNIILFGFSMGAVAIMKAQHDYNMPVRGLIIEAPYGSFQGTVKARLKLFDVPDIFISDIFSFWFGMLNKIDTSEFKPEEYGQKIHCPALLLCGAKDQYISKEEIESIFDKLASEKKMLRLFEKSEHEDYMIQHSLEWKITVDKFLEKTEEMDVFHD